MLFKRYLLVVSVLFFNLFSFSQGAFKLKKGDKQDKIKFKLINSLVEILQKKHEIDIFK